MSDVLGSLIKVNVFFPFNSLCSNIFKCTFVVFDKVDLWNCVKVIGVVYFQTETFYKRRGY